MNNKTINTLTYLTLRVIALPLDLFRFTVGYIVFCFQGTTPAYAYQALISLHGMSKGYFGNFVQNILKLTHPPKIIKSGMCGSVLHLDQEQNFLSNMNQKGFYAFETQLPKELCQDLIRFASETPAVTEPCGYEAIYDSKNPKDFGYYFDESLVLNCLAVQKILTGINFPNLAQLYLGSSIHLSNAEMWWSVAKKSNEDSQIKLAQMYHYDMDRIRWVKFFIYLTPVDSNSGPHTLIEGSHRAGKQPWSLLRHYYSRIDDGEMLEHFDSNLVKEIYGQVGSIIAVDTRAFHKGKPPLLRDRLIFEVEYASSMFGATYTYVKLDSQKNEILLNHKLLNPTLYPRYVA